jgi:hypothetical protein
MGRSTQILTIVGAVLVVLGAVGLAVPVFATDQTTEVANIGGLSIDAKERSFHSIPPLVSGGVLLLGIVLVGSGLYGRR